MTKRVLGIDFGLRRVGVALSDPLRIFATRLLTLERRRDDGVGPIQEIAGLCRLHGADTIVIGLPLRTDGRESEIALAAEEFAKALAGITSCRIEMHDERYTSLLASRIILDTQKRKKRDKALVDRIAAEIILQDWLDRERGGLSAFTE